MLEDGRAVVYGFSYDDAGNPAWFFGVGESIGNKTSIADMYITSGGRFGQEFDPDEVLAELWGSMDIELGCDYGKPDYITDLNVQRLLNDLPGTPMLRNISLSMSAKCIDENTRHRHHQHLR